MGLILIIGFISFVFLILSINIINIGLKNFSDGFSTFGAVIGIVSIIIFLICFLEMLGRLYDYTLIESNKQKALIDRSVIERKLQETYNQDNLNAAIDFNAEQKKIKIENEIFLQKYNTATFYVDTIEIPNIQYIPKQKIELITDIK
jgi:hypothetical protein